MCKEIISYVYPTLIKESMPAGNVYLPQISIVPDERSATQTLSVTAGFILHQVGVYYMEVCVYRNDESLIVSPDLSDGLIETKFYERAGTSTLLTIYSMIASKVDLSHDGIYRVSVKTYRSQDGVRDDHPAAENECFFHVSHRD